MPLSYISRLNPTQLNNLNLSQMVGAGYTLQDGKIESNKLEVSYQKVLKENETPMLVFQAVSDTKKPRQNLAYINDVIQQFEQNNPDQKAVLLMPLMQSRLWKQHCVLAEVTIAEGRKEINIHDSQAWWRNLFYPNCLKGLKKQGYHLKYNNYGRQSDNYSCTFFVYHYIKEILITGISEGLKNIFAPLSILKGEDPIGKLIQGNFKQKFPETRSVQSGEFIPWQKESLEECLNKNYLQELNQVNLDEDFSSEKKSLDTTMHKGDSFFSQPSNVKQAGLKEEQNLTYRL